MTRRYDEITFRRRLRDVLTADGLWSRMFSRGVLWSGVEPSSVRPGFCCGLICRVGAVDGVLWAV